MRLIDADALNLALGKACDEQNVIGQQAFMERDAEVAELERENERLR